MYKPDLEKTEEPKIKLSTFIVFIKKKNESEKERLEQIVHQGEAGKHLNGFKSQPPGGLKLDVLEHPAATGRNVHC